MKRSVLFVGIAVMLLAVGLVFAGCSGAGTHEVPLANVEIVNTQANADTDITVDGEPYTLRGGEHRFFLIEEGKKVRVALLNGSPKEFSVKKRLLESDKPLEIKVPDNLR